MDRLLLEKNIVREYSGEGLASLLRLVSFYGDMRLHMSALRTYGCGQCDGPRKAAVEKATAEALASPNDAYGMIASIPIPPGKGTQECGLCKERYSTFIDDMAGIGRQVSFTYAVPFVRPRFSSSKILMEPPASDRYLSDHMK